MKQQTKATEIFPTFSFGIQRCHITCETIMECLPYDANEIVEAVMTFYV